MGKRSQKGKAKSNSTRKKQERSERKRLRNERRKQAEIEYKQTAKAFKNQLAKLGLHIRIVQGDGNCLFRSIADQLYGGELEHVALRAKTVEHMRENENDFKFFITDDVTYEDYLNEMGDLGEWGGNLELQALSIVCEVNFIIHRLKEPCYEIRNFDLSQPLIHLSYHNGDHYNSVRLKDDLQYDEPAKPIPYDLIFLPDGTPKPLEEVTEFEESKTNSAETAKKEGEEAPESKTKEEEEAAKEEHEKRQNLFEAVLSSDDFDILLQNDFNEYPREHVEEAVKKFILELGLDLDNLFDFYSEIEEYIQKKSEEDMTKSEDTASSALKTKVKSTDYEDLCEDLNEKVLNNLMRAEYIITKDKEIIRAPGKTKKCHCQSRLRYKDCCKPKDLQFMKNLRSIYESWKKFGRTQKKKEASELEASQSLASLKI